MATRKVIKNVNRKWQPVCFLICLLLMAVVPIWHDHKLFGLSIPKKDGETTVETLTEKDGAIVVNTTELGKGIIGYRGPTPVEIYISGGVIQKVEALPNQETPEFLGAVRNSDLLERLDGKTPEEASKVKLDAVSGATYTSQALIDNIQTGIAYAMDGNVAAAEKETEPLGLKFYITLAIILAGGIIPIYFKNGRYRTLQLVLNVLLLGFWGGTFISYSQMMSYMTNGITKVALIPAALMLIAAFIYPFFGKKNHYCAWMCPYGSLQELLGKCVKKKIHIPVKVLKDLDYFRQALWFALMWLLWTGLWFDWMGYEPFAAFFFTDASAVVLGIAGAFLILSFFVNRPYCRFVCPTGSLFKYSEGSF